MYVFISFTLSPTCSGMRFILPINRRSGLSSRWSRIFSDHSRKGMEKLLEIVSEFEGEMYLQFNPEKSAIVEFAKCTDADRVFEVLDRTLPVQNSYKYFDIILCDKKNYLEEQGKSWEAEAEKMQRQMYARSLWRFNRFEVTKIQWKSIG